VAEIEKFMNIAVGDIEKIMNIAKDDIEKIMGVEVPASSTSYQGNRGVAFGGYIVNDAAIADIEYKAMSSDGNTLDFGDITTTTTRFLAGTVGNDSRAVCMGGELDGAVLNEMDYITIASTGDGTDFGDTTVARRYGGGSGNGTRGILHGGHTGSQSNVIDYITVASTGDSTDFGNMTRASSTYNSGNANLTRGIWWMSWDGDYTNKDANYVTIASTGDAGDFGDWSFNVTGVAAIGLIESKNIWGGGRLPGYPWITDAMEYVNPASTGDSTDQGDLESVARHSAGKFTDGTRGELWGGSAVGNTEVQKITIASSGDAAHAGDIRSGAIGDWEGWTGD